MKINSNSRILIVSDDTTGAYKYQYAFGAVPQTIERLGHTTQNINSKNLCVESYKKVLNDFKPDLIFCYLQQPLEVIRFACFLDQHHPVPVINWYLEDPNAVIIAKDGTHILDATAKFDYWFSQDKNMLPFWKTKSAFMPPAFDDTVYYDMGLAKIYDVSYIGGLGPPCVTKMYWPYMQELAKYGRRAMLCINRPMGMPLLSKTFEKFIRSKKRRAFLQALPFWKCQWQNPIDEKGKCRIINQSKIHFGMVRVRGDWEKPLRRLLPNYPLDRHGLFYQLKGRLFQGVGAGTMVLNEYCPELDEMFDIGKEIVTFEFVNINEFKDKLAWHIKHDDERMKIAKAGYERGRKQHTFSVRIKQILDIIGWSF